MDLAKVFRAMSDPTRLAIYQAIRGGGGGVYSPEQLENSIARIAARFSVSLSTVSHHIKDSGMPASSGVRSGDRPCTAPPIWRWPR